MFNIIHRLIKQVCLPRPVNVLQPPQLIRILCHGWPQSFSNAQQLLGLIGYFERIFQLFK